MVLLGDPLTTRPIQTGWGFTIEPYPSWLFRFIDNPDHQFGNSSVWTRTRTRIDSPEPSPTLLAAAWRHNLCPEIIATIPRETLAGEFNLSWAGWLLIGANALIPEGTGLVPPPIVHLVAGFVKRLPHIWAGGSPPLQQWWTPAPVVQPHQLELWKVASHDWINKDYMMKEDAGPLILTPQTLYIDMSPRMCSGMNPFIHSWSNDSHGLFTDVGIFAVAVAVPCPFQLPSGAIAASWKWIYIRGISIMIQLKVAEGSPEGTYRVV